MRVQGATQDGVLWLKVPKGVPTRAYSALPWRELILKETAEFLHTSSALLRWMEQDAIRAITIRHR